MLPVVGATGEKLAQMINGYELKMRDGNKVKNYIDKIVTVTNTGASDAYVRTLIAIPEAGDFNTTYNASSQWFHWNGVSDTDTTPGNGWIWGRDMETDWPANTDNWDVLENVNIGGKVYDVYVATNKNAIAPKETTAPTLLGIFLDKAVDCEVLADGTLNYTFKDETGKVWNLGDITNLEVRVLSQAVQASGFEDAWTALDTAFGDVNPANVQTWMTDIEAGSPGEKNETNNPPVIADVTVSSDSELADAIAKGETVIGLKAGTYHMPAAAKGKTLTLIGESKDAVIEVVPAGQGEANGQLDYSLDGSTVTFNNLTIKTNSQTYAGFARLSGTYNNCVIQNTYNLGTGNSVFNDCEINITNEYLRVGGATTATFNKCVFNTEGRAILVFQDGTSVNQTVTVKDCTFNATAAANTWNGIHVAAVSADGSQGGTYVVNFEGNNVVDSDFNGLWQIKAGEANITVNGLN